MAQRWLLVLTTLIPACRRQRWQISEFEASMVYRVSSRTAKTVSKNKKGMGKKEKEKKIPHRRAQLSWIFVDFRCRQVDNRG